MNETPTPPEGYRILTEEEKRHPLPSDAVYWNGTRIAWEASDYRGEVASEYDILNTIYATRSGDAISEKGGDEPCAHKVNESQSSSTKLKQGGDANEKTKTCASNSPTGVQSPSAGEVPTAHYKIGLGEDGQPDFKILVGPNDFHCELFEPEDALWCRDLQPAWDRLNQLERETIALRQQLAEALASSVSVELYDKLRAELAAEQAKSQRNLKCRLGANEKLKEAITQREAERSHHPTRRRHRTRGERGKHRRSCH